MTTAFISHSSRDTDFAQQIAQPLTELGVTIWIDVSSIRGGTNWGDEIQKALDEADLMLLILSPDSMASVHVKREWQYFQGIDKPVIPLLLRRTKIPFQLYGLQYIDFINKSFAAAFAELCMSLKSRGFRVGTPKSRRPVFVTAALDNEAEALPPGKLIQINASAPKALPASSETPASAPKALPAPAPGELPAPPVPIRLIEGHIREKMDTTLQSPAAADLLPAPFEWIEIGDGQAAVADGRLRPNAGAGLPAFSISRYPITNAQYQVFVDAPDGYRDDGWWNYSHGARQWRAANPHPRAPGFPGDQHPRTEVSWYEAVAYCRWLAFRLGAQKTVPQVNLPTVQQWHCAAVGNRGWPYPWGDRFVRGCTNTGESGIGRTTPVTHYPQGASPYGVMDMCGNCWEWCLTDWVSGSDDLRVEAEQRFILGGTWRDARDLVCVQHQPCRKPGVRKNTQGFRIAATFAQM